MLRTISEKRQAEGFAYYRFIMTNIVSMLNKWRFGESFALNELDWKLRKYINYRNGFFVEAGANDGITQSNTYHFEQSLGWKGLLIEPIPKLAEYCKAHRPKCQVENYALVDRSFTEKTISITYCNLMSVVSGAMKSKELEDEHISLGAQVQGVTPHTIDVPAIPLGTLLRQLAIEQVDLLSLDVEGFEANALSGLDFSVIKPRFILVEARFREDVDKILLPFYSVVGELSHHDVLYKVRK